MLERIVVLCIVIATSVIGGFMYGSYQYKRGVSDAKEKQYVAQLEQFKAQTLELDKASTQLLSITQQLNTQSLEWKNSYEEIVNKEPLSSDCTISASRLRSINAAIEQATATRKSSSAMSAGGKAKQ